MKLVKRLGAQNQVPYTNISKYELDKNEPPLAILLAYARLAKIPVEHLIDDNVEVDALAFWVEPEARACWLTDEGR